MELKEVSEKVKVKLAEVLGKKTNATVSISKEGEIWEAVVEVVDEEYLPGKNLASMNDIIGVYEVKMDSSGKIVNYAKKSSHKRGTAN